MFYGVFVYQFSPPAKAQSSVFCLIENNFIRSHQIFCIGNLPTYIMKIHIVSKIYSILCTSGSLQDFGDRPASSGRPTSGGSGRRAPPVNRSMELASPARLLTPTKRVELSAVRRKQERCVIMLHLYQKML